MSSHYSPSFLEERRAALDAYMQRLLVSKRGRERREGGREGGRKWEDYYRGSFTGGERNRNAGVDIEAVSTLTHLYQIKC
jgi:hypothetical protein